MRTKRVWGCGGCGGCGGKSVSDWDWGRMFGVLCGPCTTQIGDGGLSIPLSSARPACKASSALLDCFHLCSFDFIQEVWKVQKHPYPKASLKGWFCQRFHDCIHFLIPSLDENRTGVAFCSHASGNITMSSDFGLLLCWYTLQAAEQTVAVTTWCQHVPTILWVCSGHH